VFNCCGKIPSPASKIPVRGHDTECVNTIEDSNIDITFIPSSMNLIGILTQTFMCLERSHMTYTAQNLRFLGFGASSDSIFGYDLV
jgi:hypothetical protein